MHTQCLFVWLQGHLHTQRALTPPPSSSVIGLLWDRAARWQIWIQGNRKGGMDRGGGDKERGAVHYFVPSLSLSLFLCAGSGWKGLHRQGRKHVMRGDDTATETQLHPLWVPSLLLAVAFATAAAAAVSASHRGEREPKIADIPSPPTPTSLSLPLFFTFVCGWWDFNHVEGKEQEEERGVWFVFYFFLYVCVLTVRRCGRCGLSQREFFLE